HFLTRRARTLGEQGSSGQENAGRAISALGGAKLGKGLLERMEAAPLRHPLDRRDPAPLDLDRQHEAGENGLAVDEHGAGAALPELAPVLGAGEPEVLAKYLQEGLVDRRERLAGLVVDGQGDTDPHGSSISFRTLAWMNVGLKILNRPKGWQVGNLGRRNRGWLRYPRAVRQGRRQGPDLLRSARERDAPRAGLRHRRQRRDVGRQPRRPGCPPPADPLGAARSRALGQPRRSCEVLVRAMGLRPQGGARPPENPEGPRGRPL